MTVHVDFEGSSSKTWHNEKQSQDCMIDTSYFLGLIFSGFWQITFYLNFDI